MNPCCYCTSASGRRHGEVSCDELDETTMTVRRIVTNIAYPLADEPWGVRRFFVRDPFGKLVNIVSHVN